MGAWVVAWVIALLAGCSPALNWREVAGVDEPDAPQHWWFPCKPDRTERAVALPGQQVPARWAACDAQGVTWSVMALQFPGPADAAAAMAPLQATLRSNLQAQPGVPPPGVTAAPVGTAWWRVRRAGNEAVAVARFEVHGRWLVQQVLLTQDGPAWPAAVDTAALNTFFEGALTRP
jgi:hypothetical protein